MHMWCATKLVGLALCGALARWQEPPERSGCGGHPTSSAVLLRERTSTVRTDDYIQPIKDFQVARRAEPAVVCCGIRDGETVQEGLDSTLDTPAVKHCDAF